MSCQYTNLVVNVFIHAQHINKHVTIAQPALLTLKSAPTHAIV